MITGEFIESYEIGGEAYNIRKSTFIDELKCDKCFLEDSLDSKAYHLLIREGSEAAGTGRIIFNEDQVYIGRIAVKKNHRGKSIGDLIVKMLIDKAFRLGVQEVMVYSRLDAIQFYESIGFKVFGIAYKKEGVDIIEMKITENNVIRGCQK